MNSDSAGEMVNGGDQQTGAQDSPSKSPGFLWRGAIISLLIILAIYLLRLDKVIGLMTDDAWYVLIAKALATGGGYTLINSPTPGILPLYPPGFPLLLSFAYRLSPSFPENLWLLKSVSIAAMVVSFGVTIRYLVRDRNMPDWLALGVAAGTALCPPLLFLAVSTVMSDIVFLMFLMLTVYVVERCVESKGTSLEWKFVLLAAALASYTFLVRSIAISLLLAVLIYFVKERMVRAALIFAVASALFTGPWMIYSRIHAPTPQQRLEQGSNIIIPYTEQLWHRLAGDAGSGVITVKELPTRVVNNSLEVLGRDTLHILASGIFEKMRDPMKDAEKMIEEGYLRHGDLLPLSLFLSIFVLIGYFSLVLRKITFAEIAMPLIVGVIVLWPFETIRYMLPLAPFVLFYFLYGLHAVQGFLQKWVASDKFPGRWQLAQLALIAIIALHLYGNLGRYVFSEDTSVGGLQWSRKFEEIESLMQRLDLTAKKSDVIIATNPALLNLYTGHKTVTWDNPGLRWAKWKELKARYMLWMTFYPMPIDPAERNFKTVYLSRDESRFRILDIGDPETRPDWK